MNHLKPEPPDFNMMQTLVALKVTCHRPSEGEKRL